MCDKTKKLIHWNNYLFNLLLERSIYDVFDSAYFLNFVRRKYNKSIVRWILLWCVPLLFRYHEDGSKKVNACSLCIFHMVYFQLEHRVLWFTDHILQYLHVRQCLIQPNPLLPFIPFLLTCTWRTSFFARGVNTHLLLSLVYWQLPHPLPVLSPFHTPQIKLQYLHRRHQQHQPSSSGTISMCKVWLGKDLLTSNSCFW